MTSPANPAHDVICATIQHWESSVGFYELPPTETSTSKEVRWIIDDNDTYVGSVSVNYARPTLQLTLKIGQLVHHPLKDSRGLIDAIIPRRQYLSGVGTDDFAITAHEDYDLYCAACGVQLMFTATVVSHWIQWARCTCLADRLEMHRVDAVAVYWLWAARNTGGGLCDATVRRVASWIARFAVS